MSRALKLPVKILIAIALCFTAAAAYCLVQQATFLAHANQVEGRFVGAVTQVGGNHGGSFLCPQFAFTAADQHSYTTTSTNCSTAQPYSDGQTVTIAYDRRDPRHAMLTTFFPMWLATTLFLFPALILFGIAFGIQQIPTSRTT